MGAEGRVIKTTDGGESWTEQTVSGGSVQDLNDVHFVNSTVWMGGRQWWDDPVHHGWRYNLVRCPIQ